MFLKRHLLSTAIALTIFIQPALAGNTPVVELRGSERKESTRLVFDGGHTAAYKLDGSGQNYRIVFSDPSVKISKAKDLGTLSRIQEITVVGPNTVAMKLDSGQSVTSFMIGDKLIVDVKGPVTKTKESEKSNMATAAKPTNLAAAIEPSASEKDKPVKTEAEKLAEKAKEISPNITVTPDDGHTDSEGNKATVKPVVVKKPPYVVSISSTSAVPLAVYERHGYLWVLQDRENAALPPGLENMDGAIAEKIPAKGISVFRIKLPETKKLYISTSFNL